MRHGSQISAAARALGERSYKARLHRLGLERLQQIARENGKLGGRPKGTPKTSDAEGKK